MSNLLAVDLAEQVFLHYEEHGNVDAFIVENFRGKNKAKRKAKRLARKNKRATRKNKRKVKIKGFKKKLGSVVNKIGKIGVLLPFKFAMIGALKSKGVNVSKKTDLTELSTKFYNVIVRKGKANYEVENFAVSASMLAGVVSGIISFFKNLKKRKEAGEELSKSEEIALTKAEEVSRQVDLTTRDFTEEAIGETVMKFLPMALIGGVLLYLIIKK